MYVLMYIQHGCIQYSVIHVPPAVHHWHAITPPPSPQLEHGPHTASQWHNRAKRARDTLFPHIHSVRTLFIRFIHFHFICLGIDLLSALLLWRRDGRNPGYITILSFNFKIIPQFSPLGGADLRRVIECLIEVRATAV